MIPWSSIVVLAVACMLGWYRRRCLLSLRRGRLYAWLMWYVMPYARISVCHTSMTSEKYIQGAAQLRPGDIVLTTDNRALSTLCVPGDHTHALLCIGRNDDEQMMCAQMTHAGYGEVTFAEACFHASRFVILRCPDFDWDYILKMIMECGTFKGTPYDTDFAFNNGKSYCSELVYQADVERRLQVTLSRAWGTGQMVVTPDDLAAANVVIVFDSNGGHCDD